MKSNGFFDSTKKGVLFRPFINNRNEDDKFKKALLIFIIKILNSGGHQIK
ncbi:hypothetical protein GCM10022410_02360 [Amphibacillus indicireducens]|uniref:Uncharacterized protein n=1 Tax=Amphibacillus indicireducens TaxID=1076330 RepID=A0ABP7V3G3_9BACI